VAATAAGHHYTCKEIGKYATAQQLLCQGDTYLDRNGDKIACMSLKHLWGVAGEMSKIFTLTPSNHMFDL
jgi:hypothetical protein